MPAGYSITNEERKKIVRMHDEGMRYNIGRKVVIKQKSYESDGVRATGMTGIEEKRGRVCAIYRDFFGIIMENGGYRTSVRWADMLSYHADYDIAFEG